MLSSKVRAKTQIYSNPVSVLRAMIYMMEWLQSHPCKDCGECDPLKLQPDHIEKVGYHTGGTGYRKRRLISSIVGAGNLTRLKKELALCESRCASCHVKRHLLEDDSYRACSLTDLQDELNKQILRREQVHRLLVASKNLQACRKELRQAFQAFKKQQTAERRAANSPFHRRKLSTKQARQLRAEHSEGTGCLTLAKRYHVCANTIRRIIKNQRYKETKHSRRTYKAA